MSEVTRFLIALSSRVTTRHGHANVCMQPPKIRVPVEAIEQGTVTTADIDRANSLFVELTTFEDAHGRPA